MPLLIATYFVAILLCYESPNRCNWAGMSEAYWDTCKSKGHAFFTAQKGVAATGEALGVKAGWKKKEQRLDIYS